MDRYTYVEYARKKTEDYEEDDTYMAYKKDDNYEYYGKNHGYTYGDDYEEVDAGDYSHKKSKDYEEDDAYMPYKKDTYYDRRQQRVAPRSLLPGDLFGNGECISGPWAVVGGS